MLYSDKPYLKFYFRHCANDSCGNFDLLLSLAHIMSQEPYMSAIAYYKQLLYDILLLVHTFPFTILKFQFDLNLIILAMYIHHDHAHLCSQLSN